MKHQDYSVEDFLIDEDFKSWVLSPAEESDFYWNSWLKNHPESLKKVKLAREILLAVKPQYSSNKISEIDKELLFSKIIKNEKSSSGKARRVKMNLHPLLKAAAILLITLFLSLFLADKFSPTAETEQVVWVEKSNSNGEMSTIYLPDGSKVKLAANSQLRFPEVFSPENRNVWLTGKAFFEVKKNNDQPFLVHTENIFITVLGTSFNVAASEDGLVDVALVSGKVLVQDSARTFSEYLNPNQKLTLDKNTILSKSSLDYDQDVAWKDGILILRDESLEALSKKLENWYGVKVEYKNISGKYQFNGRFRNKSLEYVMEAMAYASDIDYIINGNKLTISTKK